MRDLSYKSKVDGTPDEHHQRLTSALYMQVFTHACAPVPSPQHRENGSIPATL